MLFGIIVRPGNRGKPLHPRDDHIVVPTGTVDDDQIAVLIPAAHDPNVFVTGINTRSSGCASLHEMEVQ